MSTFNETEIFPCKVALASCEYGKQLVRVLRVVRGEDGWNDVIEYSVNVLLKGDIARSYTHADNSKIVATDTMKNTVHVFAKTSVHVLIPEQFAMHLGLHFLKQYSHISSASVEVVTPRWSRMRVGADQLLHKHSFVRDGSDIRFAKTVCTRGEDVSSAVVALTAGLRDLLVLKSSGSAFENFMRDEYTTLPEASNRILSTSVDMDYSVDVPGPLHLHGTLPDFGIATLDLPCNDTFNSARKITLEVFATDESASVQATLFNTASRFIEENPLVSRVDYRLPNKHYLPINLDYIGLQNMSPSDAEVFLPIDAPSGLITASIMRQ